MVINVKVLINFEFYKDSLSSLSTIPLYEKVKNVILIEKNSFVKLKLDVYDSSVYSQNNIQSKNFLFIQKLNFLYSRYERKIILELNVSTDEVDEINKLNPFGVCFTEDDDKLGMILTEFYKGIYKINCEITLLIKNLIEKSINLHWQKLTVVKEYILLGTGEIINRIDKGERVNFSSENMILFDNAMYMGNEVNIVNDYLKSFYNFLKNPKDDEVIEKYNTLKEEIKSDYSKTFASEVTVPTVINSFIREGIYLGIFLKNTINNYRSSYDFSNTYRSQLSYISKFKRMVSSDFIKGTISNINDERIKTQLGDLFSKYNECKFFFDSYKDNIISFTDIEEFAFYFQRLAVVQLNLSEAVITLTTDQLKNIFNNFYMGMDTNYIQPKYNLWCIPYTPTGKPEIVVMLDKMTGEAYKIMRTDDMTFVQEYQRGYPYILESIVPIL